ncbi:class I SAM-dependent methyltransferase [Campylobacter jejuni]|nr:class I SAM-dependent methyltransferase [Campylobacter jejuni]EDP2897610.1 class I SAM-dependent methyltransferase [Campylobacter jejuni]EGR9265345.1 class I SAM-dependent methyltransferase [Campylobacter jejuni]MCW1356445.1 Eco57I restriction-modification methylase domain-containing protein [Campylobacter jejuni]
MKQKTTKNGFNRELGQFFSPPILVEKCISLIQNKNGRLLEPSCGNGAFRKCMNNNSVFIEIDKNVIINNSVLNMDFFEYDVNEKFDTIIGNPPYVDNKFLNIKHQTSIKIQANLYLYFIEKCFYHLKDGGEIIFIVPRDFIKMTSAKVVNNLLHKHGTITHFYDYGDKKLFKEACPNICIFRYEKNNFSYKTDTFLGKQNFLINDGIITFSTNKNVRPLGDFFDIKVGAVSGKDEVFVSEKGEKFVYSKTATTKTLKRMIYNKYDSSLEKFKNTLLNRRIKKFDETNWWHWGREVDFRENQPRIYVNCKTRNKTPFFTANCDKWDGSILALFFKKNMDLEKATKILNSIEWDRMGFVTGGRYIFSQKSLKEALVYSEIFE